MREIPTVLTYDSQEFNGEIYKKYNRYYENIAKIIKPRLHVAVWIYYNGPVPDGHHVHHFDEDRDNNHPENLRLETASKHQSDHMQCPERKRMSSEALAKHARPKAAEWHRSEEGREWHREHAKGKKKKQFPMVCSVCGIDYLAKTRKKSKVHFCSNKCKSAHRRNLGLDLEPGTETKCEYCGSVFLQSKLRIVDKTFCKTGCYNKSRIVKKQKTLYNIKK